MALRVFLFFIALDASAQSAMAGMPMPVSLTDVARLRVQTISFFLLVLLLSAAVIRGIWNSLSHSFPKLPRLSYAKALGLIVLWGLPFTQQWPRRVRVAFDRHGKVQWLSTAHRQIFSRSQERANDCGFPYTEGMTTLPPFRALERIVRGFSCHRRIQILTLLEQSPQPLSLSQIAATCRANIKSVGEHTQRLSHAGLIAKRSRGRETLHHITPLGKKVIAFLQAIT